MSTDNKIIIESLDEGIPSPRYAMPGDGGLDCYCTQDMVIAPGEFTFVPLGIKIQPPEGCIVLVLPKSGLASKQGFVCTTGLIDNGFRGEVKMMAHNISDKDIVVTRGQKVCQMLVLKIPFAEVEYGKVDEDTARGESGWGSTGLK